MTAAERRLWLKIQRAAGRQTPAMNKAMLDAFEALRKMMTHRELMAALRNPDTFAERVLTDARMRQAMIGVRQEISRQVRDGVLEYVPELPGGGRINGVAVIGFNVLDPRVIEAVRKLDSRVMVGLRDDMRETFREVVRQGIENGRGHQFIARRVRQSVGLAPNQVRAVENFREALASGNFKKALGYRLRDRRFDSVLRRGGTLSAEQVERMASAYQRKFIAWNANTHARTAALDAQRLGKHLATQEAIDAGLLDIDKMVSQWVDSDDGHVRPKHEQADGEVVRFGHPFPTTGEIIPGESTYNCRCIKRDYMVDNVEAALVSHALETPLYHVVGRDYDGGDLLPIATRLGEGPGLDEFARRWPEGAQSDAFLVSMTSDVDEALDFARDFGGEGVRLLKIDPSKLDEIIANAEGYPSARRVFRHAILGEVKLPF